MIEARLFASGVRYTVFRSALFMDVYLAIMGSGLPLRGAHQATLRRPFWSTRLATAGMGHSIERIGLAFVPGTGRTHQAFISIADVARFLARSVGHPRAQNAVFDLGGPQAPTWDEAVDVYARVLRRRVRALHIPARALRAAQLTLRPVSPATANLLGVLWLNGTLDSGCHADVAELFGVSLTNMEEFLSTRSRAST